MTFQINGQNGTYDNKIKDESTRYGRNAINNNFNNLKTPITNDNNAIPPVFDFSIAQNAQEKNLEALEKYVSDNDTYLKSLPPLEYEYRYMPNIVNGQIDKKALLGASLEEMGGIKEIPVKDFEENFLLSKELTCEPLDINKDAKIDNTEYATSILATDMLSKGASDISKIDGTINNKGLNAILEYSKISNAEAARNLYKSLYNHYDLGNP